MFKIEERLNINSLEILKRAFIQNSFPDDVNMDGSGQMTLEEFTRIVKRCLGPQRGVCKKKYI